MTTEKIERLPANHQNIAQSLGRIVGQVTEKVAIGGLVLTGGDTALGVLQSLECRALWLHGEIEPGIPWGQLLGGSQSGLPINPSSLRSYI